MNFNDGVEQEILARDIPSITFYGFFALGYEIFTARKWGGENLKRMPQRWDQIRTKNLIRNLEKRNTIVPDTDFRSGVWRNTQSTRASSAEEAACIADPFAYVSHMSAMQKYGLTNRSPVALHLTTPKRSIWNNYRDEKLNIDFPKLDNAEKPELNLPGFKKKIRRRPTIVHTSSRPWEPTQISGEDVRITTIAQTFTDMLSEPHLCGGMRHVLNIWREEANHWVPEIIAAVNKLDQKIIKVRAGYILSEVMMFEDLALQEWEKYAQRGGSRKLDPGSKYAPEFSERWMISVNV